MTDVCNSLPISQAWPRNYLTEDWGSGRVIQYLSTTNMVVEYIRTGGDTAGLDFLGDLDLQFS